MKKHSACVKGNGQRELVYFTSNLPCDVRSRMAELTTLERPVNHKVYTKVAVGTLREKCEELVELISV
jgi:hypothetical protein